MNSSEVAERSIREKVITGAIRPGAWLRETTLADTLGVSRTPIREACNRLARDGLIDWEPKRGFRSPRLDPAELEAVYPVVVCLETLAVESMPDPVDGLAAELDKERYSVLISRRETLDIYQADRAWHRRLMEAAGNPVLVDTHDRLTERISRYLYAYWSVRADIDRSEDEHRQVAAALRANDRPLAAALLRAHRLSGLRRIREFVVDRNDS